MMNQAKLLMAPLTNLFKATRLKVSQQSIVLGILLTLAWLVNATPAWAHHAMDGKTPTTFGEGFLSGLAHPVIGLDHLAFIVAIGLLAALQQWGATLPIAFVVAAMAGTGLHLTQFGLPGVKIVVAASVCLFGILLVLRRRLQTVAVIGLAVLAGIFHGYAYGEAIFGAQTTALVAYLLGFSTIQLMIAWAAMRMGKAVLARTGSPAPMLSFQPAGWMVCGIGLSFLMSQVLALLLPGNS